MVAMLLPTLLAAAAAAPVAAAPIEIDADTHRKEIESWRQARETRMRSDEGWLTVAGLYWLKEGDNAFGSDPAGPVVLPAHSAPRRAGVFRLHGEEVTVQVAPGVKLTLDGKAVTGKELTSDAAGKPDVLALGQVRMFLIERDGKLAIRLRDLQAPARKAFTGLKWFPIKKDLRVVGKFVAHAAPKKIPIPNVLGYTEQMESPGYVTFRLPGSKQELRLEPVYETAGADELWYIFRDQTAGKETYGAGRFLYSPKPGAGGKVVLDFNKAYSPPCAFTRFATCPLPPKQNRLAVRIEAGERAEPH
jgi:uncharacterized protein